MENSPSFSSTVPQLRFGKIEDLSSHVAPAMDAARKYLFSQQHEDGYWCGELEADTTLEADYVLLHVLLGTGDPERFQKAANWMQSAAGSRSNILPRQRQRIDGALPCHLTLSKGL